MNEQSKTAVDKNEEKRQSNGSTLKSLSGQPKHFVERVLIVQIDIHAVPAQSSRPGIPCFFTLQAVSFPLSSTAASLWRWLPLPILVNATNIYTWYAGWVVLPTYQYSISPHFRGKHEGHYYYYCYIWVRVPPDVIIFPFSAVGGKKEIRGREPR